MARPSRLEALIGEFLLLRAKLAEIRLQIEAELRHTPNPHLRIFLDKFSAADREILLEMFFGDMEHKRDVIELPPGVEEPTEDSDSQNPT